MQSEQGLRAFPPNLPVVRSPHYIDVRPETEDNGDGEGWQRYWQVIAAHKFFVVAFALLGLVLGFAIFIPQSPVYSAATTLELLPINSNFMNMNALDPMAGVSDTTLNAQTQIAIIKSGSILGPATERMEREDPSVISPPADRFSNIRGRLGILPKEPVQAFKDALGVAAGTLAVRLIPNTRIIEIRCESTIPEVAASYVNAIAAEYQFHSIQSRSGSAQKTTQWLASQLEETKARLSDAEGKLQEFIRKSGNMFAGETEPLSSTELKQLQVDLAAAQTDRIAKQNLYEASLVRPAETFPTEFSGRLNEYNSEIAKLRGQMAELGVTYTPKHPKVQQLQSHLNELEAARDRERIVLLARIQGEYQAALTRERLLQKAYSSQAGTVSGEANKAAQYVSLKREVEILRQTLNSLLQQSNQSAVASAVPVQSSQVIDPARPAGARSGPSLSRHLATGCILGGLLGYLIAMLLEGARKKRMVERFGLPGYASRVLNIPELGVIPSAEVKTRSRLIPQLSWNNGNGRVPAGNDRGLVKKPQEAVELITWRAKPSLLAESFRLTLASLTRRETNGAPPTIVLVTSPGPGEGKTTVATNIAIARAETNRRVLLLETDLRRPRIADVFGLQTVTGWGELILQEGEFRPDILDSLISPTTVPQLFALGGGAIGPESIHKVFNSPKVPLLLAALRRKFDMIVIDTPPVLHFPEARLMGRLSDGVVLVIRSDHTDRIEALAAQEKLWEDGIPILGTVLNDWHPTNDRQKKRPYGGYYSYYHGYSAADPTLVGKG
jgi:polysaccharide biosynthesis transport protein